MFKSLGNYFGVSAKPSVALHPTSLCPECGSQLARPTGTIDPNALWLCPNPDCPPHVRQRLVHWCSPEAMDIKGCDAALVSQLIAKGLALDPSELYRLRLTEVAALKGMDEKKAMALQDEIMASKAQDAWRVLHGLAIPQVGAEEAKALCRNFRALDDLFAAGKERIQTVGNVSEVVANSVAYWYADSVNRRLVARLWKYGVNFKSALYNQEGLLPPDHSLQNC